MLSVQSNEKKDRARNLPVCGKSCTVSFLTLLQSQSGCSTAVVAQHIGAGLCVIMCEHEILVNHLEVSGS